MTVPRRLKKSFFCRHHVDVARDLLGCQLVWDGVSGIVVETEAYGAEDDPACHTWFRPSSREFFLRNQPGTTYVYMNYGIHWLLNVLTKDGIVLFRALEPSSGIELMQQRRGKESLSALCSGPGKLGQALALSGQDHGSSLLSSQRYVCRPSEQTPHTDIVTDYRVGLSQGLDQQWRFLIADHPHVSVPAGKAISTSRIRKQKEIREECPSSLPEKHSAGTGSRRK